MRESTATGRSGVANSNHEPHGWGAKRWSAGRATDRTAAVTPGGASVSKPTGAPVAGSNARQTGTNATPVAMRIAASTRLRRCIVLVPSLIGRPEGSPAAARADTTGTIASPHQATPRIAYSP